MTTYKAHTMIVMCWVHIVIVKNFYSVISIIIIKSLTNVWLSYKLFIK